MQETFNFFVELFKFEKYTNVISIRGTECHLGNQNRKVVAMDRRSCHCNIFWFLAVIAFLIGSIGIAVICVFKFKNVRNITDYAIVFDAGSSHTAMFIYKWEGSKFNGTAIAVQSGKSCTSTGGAISSYVNNSYLAGKSLEPCLREAKGHIPKNKHSNTPVYLGATAGMRLLRESNPKASEDILESIRVTFHNYPFQLSNPMTMVRIITGEEEGAFSWITSNYATNSFNVLKYLPDDSRHFPSVIVPTIGALDLGGASTQISFIPANISSIPKGFSKMTKLFNHDYTLYTYSFLCYGVLEARRRILANLIKEMTKQDIAHPCLPSGYNVTKTHEEIFGSPCVSGKEGLEAFGSIIDSPTESATNVNYTFVGDGNTTQCSALVASLLNLTAPCPYPRCSFNGVYQPPVDGLYYAFSAYYYVVSFLNLTSPESDTFDYDSFIHATDVLCKKNWKEVQEMPGKKDFLPWFCQEASYINVLLTKGYGFSNKTWHNINFVQKIFNTAIGWTLGFVLYHSNTYPSNKPSETMYLLTFSLLIVLFGLFILSSIGFCIHGLKAKRTRSVCYQRLDSYGAI